MRTGTGGDTVMWSGVMGAQSFLDAGADNDLLIARASGQRLRGRPAAQKLGRNGVVEASFASSSAPGRPGAGPGHGGDPGHRRRDDVVVNGTASLRVDLGAGDDHLSVIPTKGFSRIDLGAGSDQIRVRSTTGSVDVDLTHHELRFDGTGAQPGPFCTASRMSPSPPTR